jgi:hypothetical protein
MDWKELKNYLWMPVSTLPEMTTEIDDGIYKIGDAYLFTVPHHQDISPSQEPVISQVIWSPSLGSLKRAYSHNLESDDGAAGEPPLEMRLKQDAVTYQTILAELKAQNLKYMESATYRIMTDGKFVHKQIESKYYHAYFRSRHVEPEEKPYAIAVSA